MGLLDDVLGSVLGGGSGKKSGGMNPIVMAILAMLAQKAFSGGLGGAKKSGGSAAGGGGGLGDLGDILGNVLGGKGGGGLGDILGGGGKRADTPASASSLDGGSLADLIQNGLGGLLESMQQSGQGDVAQSWVNDGENKPIDPQDLGQALGRDTINQLSAHTGMAPDELLAQLSEALPDAVNQLTPKGRLPTRDELSI